MSFLNLIIYNSNACMPHKPNITYVAQTLPAEDMSSYLCRIYVGASLIVTKGRRGRALVIQHLQYLLPIHDCGGVTSFYCQSQQLTSSLNLFQLIFPIKPTISPNCVTNIK